MTSLQDSRHFKQRWQSAKIGWVGWFLLNSFHAYWRWDVVTLLLCNRMNLIAQVPNTASLAFATSGLKSSFWGRGEKCRIVRWYAIRTLGLVQIYEFPALLLLVQSLTWHTNSVCFVKLCNKATVSMSPVVCLFCLFSCCLLSWFFQFNWNIVQLIVFFLALHLTAVDYPSAFLLCMSICT